MLEDYARISIIIKRDQREMLDSLIENGRIKSRSDLIKSLLDNFFKEIEENGH